MHPLLAKARKDALRSQLADLEAQLREYESLKADHFEQDQLDAVDELSAILIKARIAQGLRQKDLAARPKGAAGTATRGNRLRDRKFDSDEGGCIRLGCGGEQTCPNHGFRLIATRDFPIQATVRWDAPEATLCRTGGLGPMDAHLARDRRASPAMLLRMPSPRGPVLRNRQRWNQSRTVSFLSEWTPPPSAVPSPGHDGMEE